MGLRFARSTMKILGLSSRSSSTSQRPTNLYGTLLSDPLLFYQIVPVVDHDLSVLARDVANMVPTLGSEGWDEHLHMNVRLLGPPTNNLGSWILRASFHHRQSARDDR